MMPKSPLFLAFLGVLALSGAEAGKARAEESDLNVDTQEVSRPPLPPEPSYGEEEEPAGEEEAYEETPRRPAVLPPPKAEDTRFSMYEEKRFDAWLHKLCGREAVEEERATRVKRGQAGRRLVLRPTNQQGSLILLLQAYVDREGACRASQESRSGACRGPLANLPGTLLRHFHILDEISQVDGKPPSWDMARKILERIKQRSDCYVRSWESRESPAGR